MADRYHVNLQTGKNGVCRAEKVCPFGDFQADHYGSSEDAMRSYEEAMEAVQDYQSSYEGYNKPLRDGVPLRDVKGAEELSALIWRAGAQGDHDALYRGVDPHGGVWSEELKVGEILTDEGFVSTSSNPDVAAWFATDEGSQCGTVVKIRNAREFPALPAPSYGSAQMQEFGIEEEDEHVLPPGMDFRVVSVGTTEWDGEEYRLVEVHAYAPPRPDAL